MLLKGPVSPERVHARHMQYAGELVAGGVTFRNDIAATDSRVLALIRTEVRGSGNFDPRVSTVTITAFSDTDDVIGVCVAGVHTLGDSREPWAYLWQLAVDPEWRMRGIGTVLLTMLPEVIVSLTPAIARLNGIYGACAREDARFYQRAGFAVLQPGLPLSLLLPAAQPWGTEASSHYSCWIARPW
ncbi:MAG: GNAT family N-acetyltransferase [Solirubrobacteraceae bacterium]|nr:GNAT family N-acetyltransferase [Solirubrobacteraceae bacterium]